MYTHVPLSFLCRRGRAFPSVSYYSTTDPVRNLRTPLAILVNGGTASAAEIVSGAVQVNECACLCVCVCLCMCGVRLSGGATSTHIHTFTHTRTHMYGYVGQDLDSGVIVGQDRTYGKGLVQNVEPLPYKTALKYTVAKYYTPSGACVLLPPDSSLPCVLALARPATTFSLSLHLTPLTRPFPNPPGRCIQSVRYTPKDTDGAKPTADTVSGVDGSEAEEGAGTDEGDAPQQLKKKKKKRGASFLR